MENVTTTRIEAGVGMVRLCDKKLVIRMARHDGGTVESALEDMFKNSQNDFNPIKGKRSSSVGDIFIIAVDGKRHHYLCKPMGFELVNAYEAELITRMSYDDRWLRSRR